MISLENKKEIVDNMIKLSRKFEENFDDHEKRKDGLIFEKDFSNFLSMSDIKLS